MRMLADDSHVISYLIFVENWEKCRKNLSSAAVVMGALRVELHCICILCRKIGKDPAWVLSMAEAYGTRLDRQPN